MTLWASAAPANIPPLTAWLGCSQYGPEASYVAAFATPRAGGNLPGAARTPRQLARLKPLV